MNTEETKYGIFSRGYTHTENKQAEVELDHTQHSLVIVTAKHKQQPQQENKQKCIWTETLSSPQLQKYSNRMENTLKLVQNFDMN